MKPFPQILFSVLLLIFISACAGSPQTVAKTDKEESSYAFGDSPADIVLLKALAKEGDPGAQCGLGLMYYKGLEGVAPDYQEAAEWLRRSAKQGFTIAQACLGYMYWKGQGVTPDYMAAYMWLTLAVEASTGEVRDRYLISRNQLEMLLSEEEMAEAKRLAREWKPKKEAQGN